MKALLLVSELEDYTISFASGVAQHLDVVLAVPRRRYAHLAASFDPAVDLHLLDWPRHRSLSNPWFLYQLTRLIRHEQPNLIHLLSNSTLWLNFAVPFWRPIPLVTTVHDVETHPGDSDTRTLPGWAPELMVKQSGHLVVHGEGLKRMVLDRYAKSPDCVHVLSHPSILRYAELARRQKMAPRGADGTIRVLLFGRIFAYKGLEHLVRAEAMLKDALPNLRVTVAGRGDNPAIFLPLMGDADRYDIRNRFIEDAEVAQLFLDTDIVVLPYTEASQSGVLNLAAAFGKPVIVTDVGELRDTVEPNGLGMVVPPGDAKELAAAIRTLADNGELRNRFGANALDWAKGPNSPERVGGQAAAVYREVVGSC
ncbi:glycosyltransferase family 4 protein [Rhizobium binae]|uniref:Glycosyltransferase involved in cell wall biosynthesis n=1 Tax=Rhizobium binae TaxID=1138190 RepID=A0ABV2MI93_9HYPH|nr:glycosyltransferase family 4 protein [Rhizobium binae]NKL48743.1 glycosyltransferase [Rhizobium leguminosarum bv. viciae]MBX4925384.1 glycosyltransferase family 4 protein [Rhizobium binae]MBX4936337.1 glycosyltransferase family 4 protein [Rhizobium binae]MBX4942654.1 glycosyltransferase family 4 protein [Rhizobium binae]MBX4950462.1 glycosyltransferase family 4 protein [Rhizobium binae]